MFHLQEQWFFSPSCLSQVSPVNPIDVADGHHLTECNDKQRDGAGEPVKQSEPIVPRALGKDECNAKGDEAHHTWDSQGEGEKDFMSVKMFNMC